MSELEIQQSIIKALSRLSLIQQQKLLKFVDALLSVDKINTPNSILQFASIFDYLDSQEFESSLKDSEQIDRDEW